MSHLVLLSPSPKTDFEIHLLQMFGWQKYSGESVANEINKMSKPLAIIVGKDENDFPFNQLILKNKQVVRMPGAHHYNGDVAAICNQIILQVK